MKSGFTLLEILIALFIFLIGATSVCALWTLAVTTHQKSVDDEQIAYLAESLLDELQRSNSIKKGQSLASIEQKTRQIFPGYKYKITFQDIGNDAIFIQIKISYVRYGRTREKVFSSVLNRWLPKKM